MKIVFMGTPDFSVQPLQALLNAGHRVVAVYTQPPRRAGRGKKPRPSPVQTFAETAGLPVFHPTNFKSPDDRNTFVSHYADIAVVVAYGLILPQEILDAPHAGCLNIHASLLPRWRGAAPIQRAIMAGDAQTGVCIMQMEAGLDTGPVLAVAKTAIAPTDTYATLHDRLSQSGASLIVQTLDTLGTLAATPQNDANATYARKIDKSESRIDWENPAANVDRLIRGISPFPGAWFDLDGQRIKVLASAVTGGAGAPGTVLDDALEIACGTGAVRLLHLQKQGKKPQDAKTFLLGTKIPQGTILG